MKLATFLLSLCTLMFLLTSCGEEENDNDLTTSIIGHYTNLSENTDIVVNKVDDTTVSISLSSGSGSGAYSIAFPTVTMNSETTFTLNEITASGSCVGIYMYSGTGTHSGNNISLFLTRVGSNPDGTTIYDCEGTYTFNESASK